MFRAPDRCTYVRGEISPTGHCRFFEATAEKAGHVDPDNARPVGFPLADPIDQADVMHAAWQMVRDGSAAYRERTIPLDQCRAMQPVVDSERVEHSEELYENGEAPDLVPLVLERDGLFYVLAGHHHVEGAMEAGATELRVQELHGKPD